MSSEDLHLSLTLYNSDNWQANKSLSECNLRMLNTEDSCDVIFRCGKQRQEVKAHRYVLISRSCVFHAMLANGFEKTEVAVPEVEAVYFKLLLRFLYTDHIDITSENASAILYAARQYGVFALQDKCMEYLATNVSKETACTVLEAAYRMDDEDLFHTALTLIKAEGDVSLQSPGFLSLSQVLVDQIVTSDDLVADEHVIFNAVNNWAETELYRKERQITPDAKRSVLGEILTKVRFPLMEHSFLASTVKASGLLSDVERLMLLEYSVSPTENIGPFSDNPRRPKRNRIHRKTTRSRFRFIDSVLSWKVGTDADAISFKSSKGVLILGHQLYGRYQSKEPCSYRVTSYLGRDDNVLGAVVQNGLIDTVVNSPVFDVLYPRPFKVSAGVWYTLAVIMEGPGTCRGEGEPKHVIAEDGILFSFRNSRQSVNGTRVTHGQIPALIYGITESSQDT